MSEPLFSPLARTDLKEILDYIARQSRRDALRFVDRLLSKCEMLAESPEMGEECEVGQFVGRVWPVGNYLIFYRIVLDRIEVVRVLHGARDWPRLFDEE